MINEVNAPMTTLRNAAEQQLAGKQAWSTPDLEQDHFKLIHELQVHKIELQMQNEMLVETFAKVDALRVKYQDLFDFAPVGYLTLSRTGEILELNRRAGEMLAQPCDKLVGRQLREFFGNGALADLELFLTTVRQSSKEIAVHTLQLRTRLKLPVYVNAQARSYVDIPSGEQRVRLTLTDVTALKMATDDVVKVIDKVSGFGGL